MTQILPPRQTLLTLLACLFLQISHATEWVRPGPDSPPGIWGIEGGLNFAIHPSGFTGGNGGPRGLIRIGYPSLPDGSYDLINFIAIEPVVGGQKAFSELERSQLDRVQGKRFWTADPREPGTLSTPAPGVEQLDVPILIEPFLNGARVSLTLSQRSDAPEELRLTVHTEPGSAPLEYCILTATMGNKVRARHLWLKHEIISSLDLYSAYEDSHFTDHTIYGKNRLLRTSDGSLIAAITRDEVNGAVIDPWPAAPHWNYRGANVTQYWRKAPGTDRDDLHIAVNGRYTYWMSRIPIPGGISYENFEMRERFHDGQQFIFGVTQESPKSLGWPTKP